MNKLWILVLMSHALFAQTISYETSQGKETATYDEVIRFYQELDKKYDQATLIQVGTTDIGKPLHLFVISANKIFKPQADKVTILVNNGIHPGEPEGIDASMMWVRELLTKKTLPSNVVLCVVPVYNVDGILNRGLSRINQNGPNSYGFRANSRNYDLNRDFIKTDSKNSESWQKMFQTWRPHLIVDTHTSNGADYQHAVTYFPTQKDKFNPLVSEFFTKQFKPQLDGLLTKAGFDPVPYVNAYGATPESGYNGFNDTPRYSSGYASLFNCETFVVELHMLKDYPTRVKGTYAFLEATLQLSTQHAASLIKNKQKADEAVASKATFPLSWKLDRTVADSITFKGFGAKYKPSEVSGLNRLYYDRNETFTKRIPFFDHYVPDITIEKPKAYIIPQSWARVIELLKINGVKLEPLPKDISVEVEAYYIEDYKSPTKPYEGHYIHTGVVLRKEKQTLPFYKGDYIVYTNQSSNRYIIETLEPQGPDSFFAWNFFDSVLGQKEHFSAYVFEDVAADLLRKDAVLKEKLEERKKKDEAFAKSGAAQLEFIYRNSPYSERSYLRYPVYRLP
ncbi:M14 family zinc carboxypeptidase [Runella sp. MFBS21]|uniref:M14 family zinc carboxypeptidase n=1 Tax=Runella sp. MFBS21 TaxID=3034018 RepID=UPI0023F8409F|nr:M14 family zinc carboxypeptidase [Runella sp. MFBS21]MDF7819413.1 M14 family zinc carboxypeptidase [Runella sp. MFBS21]